jgi:hypothetical protein
LKGSVWWSVGRRRCDHQSVIQVGAGIVGLEIGVLLGSTRKRRGLGAPIWIISGHDNNDRHNCKIVDGYAATFEYKPSVLCYGFKTWNRLWERHSWEVGDCNVVSVELFF